MTVLDDKLVPGALKILNRFGVTRNYTQNVSVYATDGSVVDTPTVFTPKISPIHDFKKYTSQEPDGTSAPSTTPFVVVKGVWLAASGLGFSPEQGDSFVGLGGLVWKVVGVERFESGESIAAFRLQVTN